MLFGETGERKSDGELMIQRRYCTHDWQVSSFDIRFWRCANCGAWQYLTDGSHPSQHPMRPPEPDELRVKRPTNDEPKSNSENEENTTDEHAKS